MILILILGFIVKSKKIEFDMDHVIIEDKKGMSFYMLLLVLVILSVFNIIPYLVVFPIVMLATILTDKNLLKQANYQLIFTFIFIFIAVGNISHIPQLNHYLSNLVHTPKATYVYSLLLSQFISNVPATIAIAPFSTHAQALYYGVNIGGLGTPVASLASIIAYSLYSSEYGENKKKFLFHFTILNFICLALMGTIGYFMI
jgi:Na+/H+ antiporter NhaD/arsenite permease-like protein